MGASELRAFNDEDLDTEIWLKGELLVEHIDHLNDLLEEQERRGRVLMALSEKAICYLDDFDGEAIQ